MPKGTNVDRKPIAVFALPNQWMREMVLAVAPADFEVEFIGFDDPNERATVLPRADFLMTWELRAEWVPLLKQCKLVQHQGVGFDHIAVEELSATGIPFAVTPEGTVNGVAEHTILLILALSKRLCQVSSSTKSGQYNSDTWRQDCHMLYGRTVGIVGLGRIGKRVAHLLGAFEANLVYYDMFRAGAEIEAQLRARFLDFDDLLANSDVITVHTPLTPQTRLLFKEREYAAMKKGSFFVHTGRGGTYDMDALYESLKSGHIGGAGLDVFNPEPPPPDHPILSLDNVICTPHMATGTIEAHQLKAKAQFDNFRRVWNGESPNNQISSR